MTYAIYKHDYTKDTDLFCGIVTSEKKANMYCDACNKIHNNINILYYCIKLFKINDSELEQTIEMANNME